ncbi:NlpC/P60 family protein [Vibrio sp. Of7-15]|uniref:NlpC/P60 family protein n=1 Tax=Vibrio sp. Of7-15 TaxID=2724879 RepID=UPI001EF2CA90|nr:NlpC/P60 family protein [Vibrio sp. Of7-15]MCG7496393.1 NlpC/P60 family protein [Vibrio sp. Of7-15]
MHKHINQPPFLFFIGMMALFMLNGCANKSTSPSSGYYADAEMSYPLQNHYDNWKGTPYRLGGDSKFGIDCSAFVQITMQSVYNQSLPRTTAQQQYSGTQIAYNELQQGDLVFFKTGKKIRHVGVYVGGRKFMHASTSKGVIVSRLDNPYWADAYWHARRVL